MTQEDDVRLPEVTAEANSDAWNPLEQLDPNSSLLFDDAHAVASVIVEVQTGLDQCFYESARNFVAGLIMGEAIASIRSTAGKNTRFLLGDAEAKVAQPGGDGGRP